MLARRLYHFSDNSNFPTQKREVMNILVNNNYPIGLVKSYLARYRTTHSNDTHDEGDVSSQDVPIQPATTTYLRIPYVFGLSEQIRKILQTENEKIVFYHTVNVGSLYSRLKDSIPSNNRVV